MSTVIGAEVTDDMKEEIDEYVAASDTAASRSAALRELVREQLDEDSREEYDSQNVLLAVGLSFTIASAVWLATWEKIPDWFTGLPLVKHSPNLFPLTLLAGTAMLGKWAWDELTGTE